MPLLLLGGCVASHAPPFASMPYAPFSRSAAVAIALDEWRLWGERVGEPPDYTQTEASMGERQPGLWQRVGEYWWEGMNADQAQARWTGKHDAHGREFAVGANGQYAWSAAFICYIMRIAGAGPDFPYAPDHATYINAAARGSTPLLRAQDPARYAPRLGDIACFPRGGARGLRFADLPTTQNFPAHCALVVGGGPGDIDVIGGNVDDAVVLEHLQADAQGRLAGNQENWFVVLQVQYLTN